MKKIISIILATITIIMTIGLVGCSAYNKTIADFNYQYDRAIIRLANDEVIEVKVDEWCDYEGEQIQIKAEDGTIYLTSSYRCDLINDK